MYKNDIHFKDAHDICPIQLEDYTVDQYLMLTPLAIPILLVDF